MQRLAWCCAVVLFAGVAGGCSRERTEVGQGAAPIEAGAAGPVDESCSSQSIRVVRDEIPTTGCTVDGAECRFSTIYGLEACAKFGKPFADDYPPEWECRCASGGWSCELTNGSLGLMVCPAFDGGVAAPSDSGADADSAAR